MTLKILHMGFLSSFFVSEEILIPLLNAIEIDLAEKHSDYRLLSKEPLFYYQHVDFLYGRFDDKLVLTLKIPLTIFQNYFQVFSVKTFPLRLPKSDEHLVEISGLPSGIAIEQSRERFYLLTISEIQKLHAPHSHNIGQKVFFYTKQNSCLVSIFKDKLLQE